MGTEKAHDEAIRWLGTARSDLSTADILTENERYAHACFHAQQAAVKAVKAVWYSVDADPWGHSVQKLIQDLKQVDEALHTTLKAFIRLAAKLDRFYIPTRYPNGLPDLIPEQAFFRDDATAAVAHSESIVAASEAIVE